MRIWAKIFFENHMLRDTVVENTDPQLSRTAKVFAALNEVCYRFDLSVPIWLDTNIREFQRHAKTRFRPESFVDSVDFDFLEFQVLEEDPR